MGISKNDRSKEKRVSYSKIVYARLLPLNRTKETTQKKYKNYNEATT